MRLIDETEYQERLAKVPMEERTFRRAVEVAEDMPTIDAVPVVRCKDCKHWEEIKHGKGWCTGFAPSDVFADFDDFCSYGERKDGDA